MTIDIYYHQSIWFLFHFIFTSQNNFQTDWSTLYFHFPLAWSVLLLLTFYIFSFFTCKCRLWNGVHFVLASMCQYCTGTGAWNSSSWKTKTPFSPHIECHGWWWLGDTKSQAISWHDINWVISWYFIPCTIWVKKYTINSFKESLCNFFPYEHLMYLYM